MEEDEQLISSNIPLLFRNFPKSSRKSLPEKQNRQGEADFEFKYACHGIGRFFIYFHSGV